MDIQRQFSPKPWYKTYKVGIAAALIATVAASLYLIEPAGFYAKAETLATGEVKSGAFKVDVRANGVLASSRVRWLSANVSGRVEEIFVRAGAQVSIGEPILTLSNPALVKQAEETRWELEASQAEHQALVVSLASQLLDQQANVQNAKMQYDSARIKLDAESELIAAGNATVSKIDFQRSELETAQFLARWNIEKQRQSKLAELQKAETYASEARINKLRKTLARAEEQVANLSISASIDGVLQAMPLEPGQQVNLGDNIAKLARQDQLIAQLQVPERQIRDVQLGLPVVIDTRLSKLAGSVIRIDPAVVDGTVQVDVSLTSSLPGEARPDLSITGKIQVARLDQTLYVARPGYAQSQSQSSVYRLSDDGMSAEKVSVRYGMGSSNEIQILAGLRAGDTIILSDSSAWEHLDRIRIQ